MEHEMPSFLSKDMKLIFFGGKGGVGKTACAAAVAFQAATHRKTLIMSINPAHSLSDIFGCEIGNKVTKINDNLYALEIDAGQLLEDYKRKYETYIMTIADRGTYLDAQDLSNLFDLSLPGIDEIMAMRKLMDFIGEDKYELFIIDTAATGHMARFLSLPKVMEDFVNILSKMQNKYRYIASRFQRRYKKDEMDEYLEAQIRDIKDIKSFITSNETEFVPVSIPEAMGIEETDLLIKTIEDNNINVENIILNMIYPSKECDFCASKREDQEKYVEQISSFFPNYDIIKVPLFPNEIKGVESLAEFGEILSGKPYKYKVSKKIAPKELPENRLKANDLIKYQLLLFGGKGGLGKTTVAAAVALFIAKTSKKKVLIFSTDPAQALGRSFDLPIGNKEIQIKDNLYAVGMDADEMFDEFKKEYIEEINETFDAFVGNRGGIDLPFDREIFDSLIDLSPPGLDELMALSKIMDLMKEKKYDLFILDTAPSGHLLRLLELPDIVMDWLSALIKLQMKYRGIVSLYRSIKLILTWKMRLKKLIKLLKSHKKTEFVVVCVPEEMGIVETERVIARLHMLEVAVRHILINKVYPQTECGFCGSKRVEQLKYIKEIYEKFPDYEIGEIPLFPYEIRGVDRLTNFADVMFGGM